MLRLRLIALIWSEGFHVAATVKENCLAFLPTLLQHGTPELIFYLYCLLVLTCSWTNDPEALIWAERAAEAARAQQDELAEVMAAAYAENARVILGLSEPDTLSRLEGYLTYLEAMTVPGSLVFEVLGSLQNESLTRGNFEQALAYGNRLLNIAKGTRNMYGISVAGYSLANTCTQMGRPAQAARHLLDVLDWHVSVARVWQTLGCLMSICSFPEALGHEDEAVAVLSMVYHHPEAIARVREQIDAARPRLQASIGPAAFAVAWERGRSLSFEDGLALVRAALLADAQSQLGE